MAIRIEILSLSDYEGRTTASVALYVAVPPAQQSALAINPAKVPAGTKLTLAEIQDLKDGKIIEQLESIDITGLDNAALRAAMVALWQERRPKMLAAYAATKRLVGDVWTDAPGWVNA